MKIIIPHIHKIEGEAGFWAKVTREGKIEELKIKTLEGLRQIEGILIGRRFFEVPMIISRICGICPVVHTLNSCVSLEKILNLKVSPITILLRKLMLIGQIIQSHSLHLFFLSLADFFKIENDLDLLKKFPKESKAIFSIRDYSTKIINIIGGRSIHPITPTIGGFLKFPEKKAISNLLEENKKNFEAILNLAYFFENLDYPILERKQIFASLFSKNEFSFYQANRMLIDKEMISLGDFYSVKIQEDFKIPPVKKVKYKEKSYMVGAIARVANNFSFLNPQAKIIFKRFSKNKKNSIFSNIFLNVFFQMIEIVHFFEEIQKIIKEILKEPIELEREEVKRKIKIKKGSGLSVMEAPRGTLFTYFELDKEGRVFNCNIITPTAQFLNNLEEDLKIYLPKILNLPQKERIRKIRALIRTYDPCISCAVH